MKNTPVDPFRSIVPPLYLGISYEFNSVEEGAQIFENPALGYAYGRMGNPTVTAFEKWLAKVEGVKEGSVWATSSGLSALSLLFWGLTAKSLGRPKRVVISPYIYGGSFHQLQLWRNDHDCEVVFVDNPFSLFSWEKAIKPGAAFVFLETPTNPTLDIFDIKTIAKIAHTYNTFLVVDNTVTPVLQKPLELGADAILYSVTKALNRQSTGLGGALIGSPRFLQETEKTLNDYHISTGAIMHPLSAYFTLLNRTTLQRDMELFSANALQVAQVLEGHTKVKKVHYPFLPSSANYALARRQMTSGGGLLSFELESFEGARRLVKSLQSARLAPHLGDENENLIIHPASTTHSKLSPEELSKVRISPELVRLSVSLGEMDELISELDEVLKTL
ncbi:MAG: PLP-dependent transferase [Candidatus Yanofskybacteria bacterium]|nr:PLP-dependent transferase [Candidatus Yanofskybacteria bacterium]